jgi:flagellar biosynthesis chaperone FliJ
MSMFNQSKNGTEAVDTKTVSTTPEVEKAVHVALGIPAAVADVVNDAVERWTNSSKRDKDLKVLREQLDKAIAVAEKKGVEVRKQLPGQVERSLKVVEKRGDEVRKQAVEQARSTRERVEPTLRKVGSEARTRGKKVSDTTQEQITRVRDQLTS